MSYNKTVVEGHGDVKWGVCVSVCLSCLCMSAWVCLSMLPYPQVCLCVCVSVQTSI